MTFEITKASDCLYKEVREVNSIEDLKKLSEEYGKSLIIRFTPMYRMDEGPTITIYDAYVE